HGHLLMSQNLTTHSLTYLFPRLLSSSATFFFFTDTAPPEIYTLSLHDALPISTNRPAGSAPSGSPGSPQAITSAPPATGTRTTRSEEHTSELQSRSDLVCRLLLEKKKKKISCQRAAEELGSAFHVAAFLQPSCA